MSATTGWSTATTRFGKRSCCKPVRTLRPGLTIFATGNGSRVGCLSGIRYNSAVSEATKDTIAYYDRNAADFAAQTADLDLGPLHDRFLVHVGAGGRILDAGCGVGRDALAFAQRGYEVVAFDASPAMARLARARVDNRLVVHLMRFEAMTWLAAFDGIWTCASLLDVPECSFPDVAGRM